MAGAGIISSKFLGACYLLMASLFGLSVSFQFNDPDWYVWIPLYAVACAVNLVNWAKVRVPRIRSLAKFALWLGVALFVKVSIEGFVVGGIWSLNLDMRERIVREQFGSGLVICSMLLPQLHLDNPNPNHHPTQLTKYGLPVLVGIAYGLSFIFFVFQHHDMR